jgi:hypothetical protein
LAAPVRETDPHFEIDQEDELEGDQPTYEDRCDISHATSARGGFWAGFVEAQRIAL